MAKSKAKKLRDKQVREGNRNPENGRGTYALANLGTKTTKTKKEKLNQLYKKERQSRYGANRENVVLYFFYKKCMREFPVDCSGRRADARGRKGLGRPLKRCEEAPGPPAGKRSAWNGNQPFNQTASLPLLKRHDCIKLLLIQTAQSDE